MIKFFKILILNILFLFIFNNNNLVFSQNNNSTIYNIYISSYNGGNQAQCGFGINVDPCQSVAAAFDTIKQNSLNKNPINLIFYRGYYSNNIVQDVSGYNITVMVDDTQSNYNSPVYDSVVFNAYEPLFTISSQISTYISINDFQLSTSSTSNQQAVLVYVNIPYGQGYVGVNYGNLYSISINLNRIFYNYYQASPLVSVISETVIQKPSNDWESDIDYAGKGSEVYKYNNIQLVPNLNEANPPIEINLFNCTFTNSYSLIIASPIIYSPGIPTSVSLNNCYFGTISASQSLLKLTRGRVSIENCTITNTVTTNNPLFDFVNTQVYFKDSIVDASIDSAPTFSCIGCFLNFVFNTITISYTRGSYQEDYPIFDFRKSSVTMLDNQVIFEGSSQVFDQGIISVIDSTLNIRNNNFHSNVSKYIYSDGSNIFSLWNYVLIELDNYAVNTHIFCSSKHQTNFFGDLYSMEQIDYYSTGCLTFQNQKEAIWSLLFTFSGIGIGLIVLGFSYIIKRVIERSKKNKKKNNNNNNNNDSNYSNSSNNNNNSSDLNSSDSNIQQTLTEKSSLLNNNNNNNKEIGAILI